MPAQIKIWPEDECLISQLLAQLFRDAPEHLKHYLIILPTGRLATYCLAALAKKLGCLIPPTMTTLERFILNQARSPVKAVQKNFIEAYFLYQLEERRRQQKPYQHLHPGHERELAQLFLEMQRSLQPFARIDAMADELALDAFKSEANINVLSALCSEITELFSTVTSLPAEHAWTSSPVALQQAAAEIIEQDLAAGYAQIYLVGFTSITPDLMPLLHYFRDKAQTHIWLNAVPESMRQQNPLSELIKELVPTQDGRCFEPGLTRQQNSWPRQTAVWQNPSPLSEVIHAFKTCQEIIAQGIPPSQCAILLPNEAQYSALLRLIAEKMCITANFAITQSFKMTLPGRWLHAFSQWINDPSAPQALQSLLKHPYMDVFLAKQGIPPEALQLVQQQVLSFLVKNEKCSLSVLRKKAADSHCATLVNTLFDLCSLLSTKQLLMPQWLTHLQNLIFTYLPSGKGTELGNSVALCFDGFAATFNHPYFQDCPIPPVYFWRLVNQYLLNSDVRPIGEPLAGIQILTLAEARSYPFTAAIILGCCEGSFPKALPRDELLDDWLKRKIGLPGWQSLEAREDLTFHFLKARIPYLYLSYPLEAQGEFTVRSRFIEQLLAEEPGALFTCNELYESLETTQKSVGSLTSSDLEGSIATELYPSFLERTTLALLEDVVYCPYRYLLKNLKVEQIDYLGLVYPLKMQGTLLHQIMEKFWSEGLPQNDFYQTALNRINTISQYYHGNPAMPASLFLHLKTYAWPKFIAFLEELFKQMGWPQNTQSEVAMQKNAALTANITVSFKVIIDLVLTSAAGVAVLDFKRKYHPNRSTATRGLAPQLPVYAQSVLQQEGTPASALLAGYWSILNGEWTPILAGEEAARMIKGRAYLDAPTAYAACEKSWQWRFTNIEKNDFRFYADASACNSCQFEFHCRKNDSRLQDRFNQQKHLALQLENPNEETADAE